MSVLLTRESGRGRAVTGQVMVGPLDAASAKLPPLTLQIGGKPAGAVAVAAAEEPGTSVRCAGRQPAGCAGARPPRVLRRRRPALAPLQRRCGGRPARRWTRCKAGPARRVRWCARARAARTPCCPPAPAAGPRGTPAARGAPGCAAGGRDPAAAAPLAEICPIQRTGGTGENLAAGRHKVLFSMRCWLARTTRATATGGERQAALSAVLVTTDARDFSRRPAASSHAKGRGPADCFSMSRGVGRRALRAHRSAPPACAGE